jgi:multiple sugar transport system substrate-binding protein
MEVHMKRAIILAVALTIIMALSLSASGAKEAGEAKALAGKLTIWSTLTQQSRAEQLEKIAKDYEKEHPGVSTEIVVMPWGGAFDKMVAAIMAGNPPDISTVGQGWPQSLAGTGGIITLEDVIQKIGGPNIFLGTSLKVLGSLEGKMYSVPIYVTPHLIFYRKSWLKEAGKQPPKTWEEFYDVCKAVTNPSKNRFGFAMPLGDIHGGKPIWGFLLSNGVTIFEKDAQGKWKLNVDQPAAVETYAYLYKLMKDAAPPGVVSYKTTDIRELIAKEVIMGRYDTPEALQAVREMNPGILQDFGFITLPARKRLGSSQGWVGMVVYEKGNVPVAKNFIEYMFKGETLIDFYLSYPYAMFSALESHYKVPRYTAGQPDELKPIVPVAAEILKFSAGISMWNGDNAWAGEIENKQILPNALNDMLVSGATAEAAVKKVAAEIKKLMGE